MKTVIPYWLLTTGYLSFYDLNGFNDFNDFNDLSNGRLTTDKIALGNSFFDLRYHP